MQDEDYDSVVGDNAAPVDAYKGVLTHYDLTKPVEQRKGSWNLTVPPALLV